MNRTLNGHGLTSLGIVLLSASFAYAAPPKNLEIVPRKLVTNVSASSAKAGHEPKAVNDGRASTAWFSAPGQGEGATLSLTYSSPRHIAWLTLSPGHGADAARFQASARPKEVRVSWDGGAQRFVVPDVRGPQDLVLKGFARVSSLTLTIESTHGPADAGVAISELAAYEPYEVISVKMRRRMQMTDAVEALRGDDSPEAIARVVALGKRVIPWLISELEQGQPASGVPALQALQKIDRDRAWRVAFNALNQGPGASAVVAAHYVAAGKAKDLAEAVFKAYERLEGGERLEVLTALSHLGDARALKILVAGLKQGDASVMKLAGRALSGYGEDALFEVVALAGDSDAAVRQRAVQVLMAWGDETALHTLCDLANGPDLAAATEVVSALAASEAPIARAALVHLASQPAGATRDSALEALTRGGSEGVVALIAYGAQSGPATNARVADALGRSRSPAVRAALVAAVLSESAQVTPELLRALGQHRKAGVQAVLDAIVEAPARALAAEGFLVKSYATSASVLSEALPRLPAGERHDPVRMVILKVLAHAQFVRAADQVASVYRAPGATEALKLAALDALAALPSDASREVARDALASSKEALSAAGLAAAIRLGDEEAGAILLERLKGSPPAGWPAASIDALAKLKTKAAVAVFKGAMGQASKELKLALLKAAKRIGGKEATSFLVEVSMSGEAEVSRRASELLRSR